MMRSDPGHRRTLYLQIATLVAGNPVADAIGALADNLAQAAGFASESPAAPPRLLVGPALVPAPLPRRLEGAAPDAPASQPRDRHLSRDEAARLVAACVAPHVRLFVLLALHTAARATAILDLTWDRVDFERGLIYLRDPEQPRTRKGRAIVPVNDTLAAELRQAREGAVSGSVVELAGRRVASVKHGIASAAGRAGLKGVSAHVLRHTAAVWMAEAGITMPEIAAFLGHSDSRTTERVYARFSPTYLRRAAKALESA